MPCSSPVTSLCGYLPVRMPCRIPCGYASHVQPSLLNWLPKLVRCVQCWHGMGISLYLASDIVARNSSGLSFSIIHTISYAIIDPAYKYDKSHWLDWRIRVSLRGDLSFICFGTTGNLFIKYLKKPWFNLRPLQRKVNCFPANTMFEHIHALW